MKSCNHLSVLHFNFIIRIDFHIKTIKLSLRIEYKMLFAHNLVEKIIQKSVASWANIKIVPELCHEIIICNFHCKMSNIITRLSNSSRFSSVMCDTDLL